MSCLPRREVQKNAPLRNGNKPLHKRDEDTNKIILRGTTLIGDFCPLAPRLTTGLLCNGRTRPSLLGFRRWVGDSGRSYTPFRIPSYTDRRLSALLCGLTSLHSLYGTILSYFRAFVNSIFSSGKHFPVWHKIYENAPLFLYTLHNGFYPFCKVHQ